MFYEIIEWGKQILYGANQIGEVFTTKISIGSYELTVLSLCTISGLLLYLGVALVKWLIS